MSRRAKVRPGRYATAKGVVSKHCKRLGLSFKELGQASSISIGSIRHADQGGPSYKHTLKKIGKVLGVDSAHLLSEKEHGELKQRLLQAIEKVNECQAFGHLRKKSTRLMVDKSFAHQEVKAVAKEFQRLCQRSGLRVDRALLDLWQYYVVRADYDLALGMANEMTDTAHSQVDVAHAQRALGECHFYYGEFEAALSHLQHQAIRKFSDDDALTEPLGLDPRSAAFGHAAIVLAIRGNIELANERTHAALTTSKSARHDPSLVFAHHCDAVTSVVLNEPTAALQKAKCACEEAKRVKFPLFITLAKLIQCWAKVQLGKKTNRRDVFSAYAEVRNVHQCGSRSLWLCLMAQCALRWKDYPLAFHLLDDAEEFQVRTGEHFFAAEITRTRAQLLMRDPAVGIEGAAGQFLHAIDQAKAQGAHLFQLRAALQYYEQLKTARERKRVLSMIRKLATKLRGQPAEFLHAKRLLR